MSDVLTIHGIHATAVRRAVWGVVSRQTETFTLADMEQRLPECDRSSIFRALRLFVEHRLLHEVDDGTREQRYCLCRCHGARHAGHVHFACRVCGRTYCIEDDAIPAVPLPDGFTAETAEYVIKGVCGACSISN